MKVCIIETHYHEEFLNTLLDLFDSIAEIDLYVTSKVKVSPYMIEKSKKIFYINNEEKQQKQLDKIDTSQYDLLFVNTIQPSMVDIPKWLNFTPHCKSILTLHNLNAWSNKKFILRKNIAHSIDSYITSKYTQKILKKYDIINVVHPGMIEPAQYRFNNHKIIHIPYCFAKDEIKEDKKKTIDFVIPGNVTNKRRNYEPVLQTFKEIFKKHDNIRLILLGQVKPDMEKMIEKYNCKNLVTYKYHVEQKLYDKNLQNADFIISPSKAKTYTVNTVSEVYGLTKSSNIYEAIKWRKPIIVSNGTLLMNLLLPNYIVYGNSIGLKHIINNLIKQPEQPEKIKQQFFNDMKKFTKKEYMRDVKWLK